MAKSASAMGGLCSVGRLRDGVPGLWLGDRISRIQIGLVALGFAWKRQDDAHFFTTCLSDATRDLDAELEGRRRTGTPLSSGLSVPGRPEKALAARQQARRLRWARPPPPAQLRATRERMRRELRTQVVLRDFAMCTLMLLLHLSVTHGKFSPHECSLNQAIRDTFTSLASLQGSVTYWALWS